MYKVNTYDTLDGALADVAGRSFYEDCVVVPMVSEVEGIGAQTVYQVIDDSTYMDDEWYWTNEGGLEYMGGFRISEHSRLMESYEVYTTADHIRYNLPEAVDFLWGEEGAVQFAYATVSSLDADLDSGDDLVGWILVTNFLPRDRA